jgi:bacteriocin biosynthesis cyclodehydratase domain-containing protein
MTGRYRLRPSLEAFTTSTGDFYLLQPGAAGDLLIRDAAPIDHELVALLAMDDGTVSEIAERLRAPAPLIEAKLAALQGAGALVALPGEPVTLPDAFLARFDRQLPYFAETGDPGEAQKRLRDATVVVLGCGGLGTWSLGALASAGVGRFVLIDDDVVEISNLNRQILYGVEDLGTPKVQQAGAWLARFDPDIVVRAEELRVSSPDDLIPLLDGADALVQAADWPPYELTRWVDDACRKTRVPYITAGQVPPILKIGPTYVPGVSACFTCHETAMQSEFPLYDELAAQRRGERVVATTLGPASGVVGTLIALELMHLLAGRGPVATQGRALIVDMRTLECRWQAVERLPGCPACGDLRA